jgi:hypothetical protein
LRSRSRYSNTRYSRRSAWMTSCSLHKHMRRVGKGVGCEVCAEGEGLCSVHGMYEGVQFV